MTAKSRKELLRREDAFITAAEQSAAWVHKYRTALLAAVGAVVLAAGGVWGTSEYLHKRDRDASVMFAEGLRIVELGKVTKPTKARGATDAADAKLLAAAQSTKAATGTKQAPPEAKAAAKAEQAATAAADETDETAQGDDETEEEDDEEELPVPTFATDEEKWKAALEKFESVVDKAGMRGVGVMAAIFVGDLQAKLGDRTGAQTTFAAIQNTLTKSDHLYFLAAERTAYLHEADGDIDGAIAALEEIASDDKRFYADYAQVHQARLYLKKEDKDRAKTMLEHVEHAFPHSSLSDDVRLHLTELGVVPGSEPDANSVPGDVPGGATLPAAGSP